MSQKLITVVGATGQQGTAVIDAFRHNPAYKIRGLTRNADSAAARALAASGVEVVQFDIDSDASIAAAFSGSHIIYAVADYWALYQQHGALPAREMETARGAAMARAAGAVPTLEHYIWSTLPRSVPGHPVYHFDGKHAAEAVIRADAALLAKTTFLVVCFYANNLQLASMRPYPLAGTAGKRHVQFTTYPPETPIPFIGDVANLAPFVRAVVERGEAARGGRYVAAATAVMTAGEWMALWARAKGVQVEMVRVSREQHERLFPFPRWTEEWALMMDYFEHVPMGQWFEEGSVLLDAEALSVKPVVTMEEWARTYELPDADTVTI